MDTQLQEQKAKENWCIRFLKNYYVYFGKNMLLFLCENKLNKYIKGETKWNRL